MSKDVQQSLFKFISTLSSGTNQCKYVDRSTPRSQPQYRQDQTKQAKLTSSFSPSPSTKRKHRLTEKDPVSSSSKKSNMSASPTVTPNKKQERRKSSPELESLRDEIKQDTNALIEPLKASLEILLEFKNIWETSFKECQEIRTKNSELQKRIEKVEQKKKCLNNKFNLLEDKLLEGNIIFQGIPESLWEPSTTTKEKVLTAISHTISSSDQEDKMNQVRGIHIKDVRRIGRYVAMKTHPVLVEFCHKADDDYLLSNHTNLPQGVYIDKQYSEETEREQRKLRPILRAARQHEDFKGKC